MLLWELVWKDLRRMFRSPFAVGMAFIAPLFITGLLVLAFGGISSGSSGMSAIRLVVVDLDQMIPGIVAKAGTIVTQVLSAPALSSLFRVSAVSNEETARRMLSGREADLALILPADFSQAAFIGDAQTRLIILHDPTLQVSPQILRSIVNDILDNFLGSRSAVSGALDALQAEGFSPDPALADQVVQRYLVWVNSLTPSAGGSGQVLETRSPTQPVSSKSNPFLALAMAGMMIYFVFYSGAAASLSILHEKEEGTLARLFVTPVAKAAVLGGKVLSALLLLVIQVVVLLVSSSLLFGISWGFPVSVVLASVGLVACAAGFGLFLMSWVSSSRQVGTVMGGVLTITAMVGGLFTVSIPNMPKAFQTAGLSMPQGWALQAFRLSLNGEGVLPELLPLAVLLALAVVFFVWGLARFRRRLA
ncbi:MAG: ABC transporter permease [Coprothermobacterota bacterium]|nr:ABC transporter permease [Coprothermobacterota bacterium]